MRAPAARGGPRPAHDALGAQASAERGVVDKERTGGLLLGVERRPAARDDAVLRGWARPSAGQYRAHRHRRAGRGRRANTVILERLERSDKAAGRAYSLARLPCAALFPPPAHACNSRAPSRDGSCRLRDGRPRRRQGDAMSPPQRTGMGAHLHWRAVTRRGRQGRPGARTGRARGGVRAAGAAV